MMLVHNNFLLKRGTYKSLEVNKQAPHSPSSQVAGRRVGQVVLQVLFNQVVVGLPFGLLAHHLLLLRGYNRSGELPTFHWVVFELTVCILVEEAGFYYSHRQGGSHPCTDVGIDRGWPYERRQRATKKELV